MEIDRLICKSCGYIANYPTHADSYCNSCGHSEFMDFTEANEDLHSIVEAIGYEMNLLEMRLAYLKHVMQNYNEQNDKCWLIASPPCYDSMPEIEYRPFDGLE